LRAEKISTTMTKRARRSTKRTSRTSIARMERLFQPARLWEQDRGRLVVAQREPELTGTVDVGVAVDAADRVAAAARAKPVVKN
jgi:hypothetical protein